MHAVATNEFLCWQEQSFRLTSGMKSADIYLAANLKVLPLTRVWSACLRALQYYPTAHQKKSHKAR